MVDTDAESMYVKLMLRLYDIIAQQKHADTDRCKNFFLREKKKQSLMLENLSYLDSNNR